MTQAVFVVMVGLSLGGCGEREYLIGDDETTGDECGQQGENDGDETDGENDDDETGGDCEMGDDDDDDAHRSLHKQRPARLTARGQKPSTRR